MSMEAEELRGALEAILFVSNEPVKVDDFAESFPDEGRDAIIAQSQSGTVTIRCAKALNLE